MQHTVGRRRGRRRISVAVLTTAMTLAAVVAVTAPASPAWTRSVRTRTGEPGTRGLRYPRPRQRFGGAQRSGHQRSGRPRAPVGHPRRDSSWIR